MSETMLDTCGQCRDHGHPAETLTPSEVALAKVLAAWEAWPGSRRDRSAEGETLRDLGEVLKARRFASWTGIECEVTDKGRALLDHARKAGVL